MPDVRLSPDDLDAQVAALDLYECTLGRGSHRIYTV
jgi:hypothetical protein